MGLLLLGDINTEVGIPPTVGNGHGNTSSNPGRDWLHFT